MPLPPPTTSLPTLITCLFILTPIYCSLAYSFRSTNTVSFQTPISSFTLCGYNIPPLTVISQLGSGHIYVWDKPVYLFNGNTPQLACFRHGDQLPQDDRYAVVYYPGLEATRWHMLYRYNGEGLQYVPWDQFGYREKVAEVQVGPKQLLIRVTDDQGGKQYRLYEFMDMNMYKVLKPGGVADTAQYYLTKLGTVLAIDYQSSFLYAIYGDNYELVEKVPLQQNQNMINLPKIIQQTNPYDPQANKATIIIFSVAGQARFQTTFEIVYKNAGVEIKQMSRIQIDQKEFNRVYCGDRLFVVDSDFYLSSEGNRISKKPVDSVECVKDHKTNLVQLVVQDQINYSKPHVLTIMKQESHWFKIIFLAVLGLIVVALAIAYLVLRAKRGITFVEFMTCSCLGRRPSFAQNYKRMQQAVQQKQETQ